MVDLMNAAWIPIKIKERLNKLDSADYDNIECWQYREAYNKAQIEWVRRQIHGKNDSREGDEETAMRVNDLQPITKTVKFDQLKDHKIYYESKPLPSDYLFLKRVTPIVSKEKCKGKRIKSTLREESNVDEYLQDWSLQPSWDMEETFHTMFGNKILVYTNKEFDVSEITIIYYRFPREINFTACEGIDGKPGVQTDPEFKDDIVELIIDDAAAILAGDIESINQLQLLKQRSEINN